MRKKIICFALSAMLILTFIPQITFAAEDDVIDMAEGEEITTEAQEEEQSDAPEESLSEESPSEESPNEESPNEETGGEESVQDESDQEDSDDEDSDEEDSESEYNGVITGFAPLEKSEYYYEGDPEEGELTISMPSDLGVYLNESDEITEIPVTWEAVEDFDNTDFYFYSMKPVWGDGITLSGDLDALVDVPWVTVYRQEPDNADIEPIMTEDELDPLFTEEAGPVDPETGEPLEAVDELPIDENSEEASDDVADDVDAEDEADDASNVSVKAFVCETAGDVIDAVTEDAYADTASNTAAIYKYLTQTMGLNTAAACGVMININAESAMSPINLQNTYNSKFGLSDSEYTKRVDKGKGSYKTSGGTSKNFKTDRGGYGLCQWTSSGRKTNLLNRALSQNTSVGNIDMQLGFLNTELQNYPSVLTTLKNVPNNAAGAYIAAAEFCLVFEAPANTVSTAASRGKNCLSKYWKTYSGAAASATGTSFLSLCDYSYPSAIKKCKGVDVTGYVVSNYKVTSLTGKILNSSGKSIYSKTVQPGTTAYKIANLDEAMKFAKLGAGNYTYTLTAKDSAGKTVTVSHSFNVADTNTTTKLLGFASVANPAAAAAAPAPAKPVSATTAKPVAKKVKKTYKGTFPKLPKRGYFKKGDKGKQVKNLQKFLKWYGYKIKVDGKCGKNTIKLVKKFQKANGMKATGRFGKKTLAKAKKVKK